MNWFSYFTNAIKILPLVIAGIQQIHSDAKGAEKKQIALEALGLSTAVSVAELPANQANEAQAVSGAIGGIIDAIVAGYHATNAPGFGTNSKPANLPTAKVT